MVEVIIAVVVLAVGVLGLAGTTAYIVRQVTLADIMTERSMALQSVVERVQATPYANLVAGSDSVGVFQVRWTVTVETAQSSLVTVVTTGPGLQAGGTNTVPMLSPSVADTFTFRVIS